MEKVLKLQTVANSDLLVGGKAAGEVLKVFTGNYGEHEFVVVRLENQILGYEHSKAEGKFVFRWKKNIATSSDVDQLRSYPLWLEALNGDGDSLIIRERDGLKFYGMTEKNGAIEMLAKSELFHDAYGKDQKIFVGRFFANQKLVGLMRRDKRNASNFYSIKGACLGKPGCDVLQRLTTELSLSGAWGNSDTQIYLTGLVEGNKQEMFGLRTQAGLEFYQFNRQYQIEKVFKDSSSLGRSLGRQTDDERIFFGSFTRQPYQDVLHLNSSGLFLYQFDTSVSDYAMLNLAPSFSTSSGWTNENSKTLFVGDFDGDGKSDIIYTGVDGLAVKTFNVDSDSWDDLMDPESQGEKFAKVVGAASVDSKQIVFLQAADGSLKAAKVVSEVAVDSKPEAKPKKGRKKAKLPDGSISVYDIEQVPRTSIASSDYRLRWTEQWAEKFEQKLFGNAPNQDGHVAFNVPLLDVSLSQYLKLQLAVSYSDQSQDANVLGTGWNIPLLNNHIRVDYRCSVFIEEASFSFFGLGQKMELQRNVPAEVEGSNVLRFTIPDQNDMEVSYHQGQNSFWIIETSTERFVYGADGKHGAVQMNLSWENFRCGKSDTRSLLQMPVAWFLKERKDKTADKSIFYRYNIASRPIAPNGASYTHSLSLQSISDGKQPLVSFEYAKKSAREFSQVSALENGKVVFPIPLTDDFYLRQVSIRTENYSQDFRFNYKVGEKRSLIGFEQIFANGIAESILKMDYETLGDETLMKQMELPRGSIIAFEHEKLNRAIADGSLVKKFPVGDKASIASSADYKVISFARASSIHLRVHNEIDKDELLEVPVGVSSFDFQIIVATRSMFLIYIVAESFKELAVFEKRESVWSAKPVRHKFSSDATIHLGENFIAFVKSMDLNIKIFQWNIEDESSDMMAKNLSPPNNRPLIRTFSHGRIFISYDDSHLIVFYLDARNEWKVKNVKQIVGYQATTRSTIEMFDIEEDIKKQLIASVKDNLLQVDGNQIVLTKLQESGGTISLVAHLMLLDSNYNVKEQVEVINRENVYDFNHDVKPSDTSFRLKYSKIGGKFAMRVHDFLSGYIVDELNKVDAAYRAGERARLLREINAKSTDFKKFFLLDWKKYHARLSPSGLLCGDDITFSMTGDRWEKKKTSVEQSSLTFKMGSKLVVEQSDPKVNELSFFEVQDGQRHLVHKMKIEGEFANAFPAYLAYQASPSDIKVLSFTPERTLGPIKTITNAKLLNGDINGMMTIGNSTGLSHSEPQEIQFRPLVDLIPERAEHYVSKRTLTADDLKHVASYERSFDVDEDGNLSEKFAMISGGVKSKFGWYEEIKSLNRTDKVITKEKKIFHANGELKAHEIYEDEVKNLKEDEDDEVEDFSRKLMDKSEKLEISDLQPFNVEDQNFAHFGFESYEKNSIGGSKTNAWDFPEKKVIRGGFSLTGESFLRLLDLDEQISATIEPKSQQEMFVAACWIRTNVDLQMNQESSIFEAGMRTNLGEEFEAVKATVKRQVGEWNYLEMILDFASLDGKFREFMKKQNKFPTKAPTFKVLLRVTNGSEASIDVDHIRFWPITHAFIVDVFDRSGQITATINPNGTIKRKVFNKFEQEVASIDENGRLVELISASGTGRLIVPSSKQNRPNHLTFKATENNFIDPSEWWKRWEIPGVDKKGVWSFAPSQMRHKASQPHQVVVPSTVLNMKSNVLRFDYALTSPDSSIKLSVGGNQMMKLSKVHPFGELSMMEKAFKVPSSGELILAIERSRMIVWVDGVLMVDEGQETRFKDDDSLTVEFAGSAGVENFFSLNNPSIAVEYFNAWGEPTQTIHVESEHSAEVTETLHDHLGRRTITTKATRMSRNENQPLVEFYENFIENDNYHDPKSVWFTHQLRGDVSELNPECRGFPYKRTEFEQNPSRDKSAVGLPGKEFSIVGPFSKKIQSRTDLPFLLNLFPVDNGFTMYTTVNENGSKKVVVFDVNEKKVAVYVRAPGSDHVLSINEYDSDGRIVKILPPTFHEEAGTFTREDPWRFGDEHLMEDEKTMQKLFGSHFSYDEDGNMIKKSTPDGGTVEYIHDDSGNQRFMKLSNGQVVYFNYDDAEQLIETGHLKDSVGTETLKNLAKAQQLPESVSRIVSQEFGYSNKAENPDERKAVKKFVTHNGNDKTSDEVSFDSNDHVTRKATVSGGAAMNIEKTYEMDKLSTLRYPKESADDRGLELVFKYDKQGHLVSIGTADDATQFAQISYTADGQVASEKIQPNSRHEFVRTFKYQSAGYLERISDPFLTEDLAYTTDGYGQKGFGDGIISSTAFKATWAETADSKLFKVNASELVGDKKLLARCFKVLRQAGYLSATGVVQKALTFKAESKLPLECRDKVGYQISKLIAGRQIPKLYGHRYAYGNHQELTKAKYFTDTASMDAEPLQVNSFSKEMKNFKVDDSHEVWKALAENDFITTNQRTVDLKFATGKQGKESIIRLEEVEEELKALASPTFDALKIVPGLINVIVKAIANKQFLTEETFREEFLALHGFTGESIDWQVEQLKQQAKKTFEKLAAKNLLTIYPKLLAPLNPKLVRSLKKFAIRIPDILNVLTSHWTSDVGESPFDLYSYNIDANGNHRLFYNGYQRFEIDYRGATNKIRSVKFDDITSSEPQKSFAMEHDENGNTVKALHRNIERIEYYVTSQRTKKISMTDGRVLQFFYDAIGERILKQVFKASGELETSTKYVRDEAGKVLADRKTIYHAKPRPPQIIQTKYIYGPRGLLGFIRNGDFFSVTTDHAFSVKLIVRNGQVVASYDYLPYGDLMRKFVTNPEHEIPYRFTGQEFDEETGLYNFHARLYDPAIGRFYQIDPQLQFFSPYLYAGNSPISMIDPDGEFVFTLIVIGLAVGGAYLAGAKKNNSWNPVKWNWKDPGTYLAMGGGALAGATLPFTAVSIGVTASLVAGGVGLATGYIGASAANKSLNPSKWDWESPKTYAGFFEGFTTGFNIVAGIAPHELTVEFLKLSILPATAAAYWKGVQANKGKQIWDWRWDDEGMAFTFGEMLDGFGSVISVTTTVGDAKNFNYKEFLANPNAKLVEFKAASQKQKLEKLLNNVATPVAAVISGVIKAVLTVGKVDELGKVDFDNIKFSLLGTYEAVHNGISEGQAVYSAEAQLKKSMVEQKREERLKNSTPREKRSIKWQLTLIIEPNLIKHLVPPRNYLKVTQEENKITHDGIQLKVRTRLEIQRKETKMEPNQIQDFGIIHNYVNESLVETKAQPNDETDFEENLEPNQMQDLSIIHSSANMPTYENPFPRSIPFEGSNSTFNMLNMGDQWLQQTDTIGNLTLLNLLMDKFFASKKLMKSRNREYSKTDAEYQLLTSEVVSNFVERFLEHSEGCGISDYVMNGIFENSIDLRSLNGKVETEIRRRNYPKVSKILMQNVVDRNLKVMKKHSSDEQIRNFITLMEEEAAKTELKLLTFEENK